MYEALTKSKFDCILEEQLLIIVCWRIYYKVCFENSCCEYWLDTIIMWSILYDTDRLLSVYHFVMVTYFMTLIYCYVIVFQFWLLSHLGIPDDLLVLDGNKYNPEMRDFALMSSLYSLKAYDFAKTKLPLPNLRTIRR